MSSKYPELLFNIALVHPEIPNNTGNIGRTCVGLWSKLHLVEPLGFSMEDKYLKRSGLDYWPNLEHQNYPSWDHFKPHLPARDRVFLIETGSQQSFYDQPLQKGDFFIFGKETKGLPDEVREEYSDRIFSLPFPGQIRSFNLANCVAMVMSEAFRQIGAGASRH